MPHPANANNMPVIKKPISLLPDLAAQIDMRGDNFSGTLSRHLERYFAMLDRARREIRAELSDAEASLIIDALNGTLFADTISPAMLAAEIEDAVGDLAEKWSVDGSALVKKMQTWSYCKNLAMIDAVERWWRRVGAGENPETGEVLK